MAIVVMLIFAVVTLGFQRLLSNAYLENRARECVVKIEKMVLEAKEEIKQNIRDERKFGQVDEIACARRVEDAKVFSRLEGRIEEVRSSYVDKSKYVNFIYIAGTVLLLGTSVKVTVIGYCVLNLILAIMYDVNYLKTQYGVRNRKLSFLLDFAIVVEITLSLLIVL